MRSLRAEVWDGDARVLGSEEVLERVDGLVPTLRLREL